MKIKMVIVPSETADNDYFHPPSNFYIINAFGDLVFFSTRKREKAQLAANEEYGDGKYTVRLWKI